MNVAMLLIHSARGISAMQKYYGGNIYVMCLLKYRIVPVVHVVRMGICWQEYVWKKSRVKQKFQMNSQIICVCMCTVHFNYTVYSIISLSKASLYFGLDSVRQSSFGSSLRPLPVWAWKLWTLLLFICIWIWPQEIHGNNHKANWYLHTVKLCL